MLRQCYIVKTSSNHLNDFKRIKIIELLELLSGMDFWPEAQLSKAAASNNKHSTWNVKQLMTYHLAR